MDQRVDKFWQDAQDAGIAYPDLEPLLWWAKNDVDGARRTLALHVMVRDPTSRELEVFDVGTKAQWYELIASWLADSAQLGYLSAFYGLGKMKYHGIGCLPDYAAALSYFEEIDSDGWHSPVLDYYIGSCVFFLDEDADALAKAERRIQRAIAGGYVFARIRQAEMEWHKSRYLTSIGTRFRFSAESFRVLTGKPSEQWRNSPPMYANRLYARDELSARRGAHSKV